MTRRFRASSGGLSCPSHSPRSAPSSSPLSLRPLSLRAAAHRIPRLERAPLTLARTARTAGMPAQALMRVGATAGAEAIPALAPATMARAEKLASLAWSLMTASVVVAWRPLVARLRRPVKVTSSVSLASLALTATRVKQTPRPMREWTLTSSVEVAPVKRSASEPLQRSTVKRRSMRLGSPMRAPLASAAAVRTKLSPVTATPSVGMAASSITKRVCATAIQTVTPSITRSLLVTAARAAPAPVSDLLSW